MNACRYITKLLNIDHFIHSTLSHLGGKTGKPHLEIEYVVVTSRTESRNTDQPYSLGTRVLTLIFLTQAHLAGTCINLYFNVC